MDCLKQENIENFLNGEGTDSERIAIETHLADCTDCRLSLTNLYRTNKEEFFPAPTHLKEKAKNLPKKELAAKNSFFSFLFTRQTAFVMASFLVLFSLVGFWFWSSQTYTTEKDVLRQGEKDLSSDILLSPENNANLAGEEIVFKWQKVLEANSYTLIVSDEKGDIVFEKQMKKENLSIKSVEAKLIAGKNYFWYVRAKSIDGKITETSPRKFTFKR